MIKKIIYFSLKYVSPVYLVLMTGVILFGVISPWDRMDEALGKYKDNIKLFVGYEFEHRNNVTKEKRNYIVITDKFASKTIQATLQQNGSLIAEERDGGLLQLIFSYLFMLFCAWWFWLTPYNKSLKEADALKRAP